MLEPHLRQTKVCDLNVSVIFLVGHENVLWLEVYTIGLEAITGK